MPQGRRKMMWQHRVYRFLTAWRFLQLLRPLGLCSRKILNFYAEFLHVSRPSPLLYCSLKLHNDMETFNLQSLSDLCRPTLNWENSISSVMSCFFHFESQHKALYSPKNFTWPFKNNNDWGLWNTNTERIEDKSVSVFRSLYLKTPLVLWILHR